MTRLASILCFALFVTSPFDAAATDRSATAIEGAYLLIQDDQYQRILSFDRGGNVTQVSDQQSLIGFTGGQGVWEQTGPDSVRARIIDFAYDRQAGQPIGPSLIVYELTFSDPVAGKYQKVSGSFTGEAFASGQNPLGPDEPAIRNFGIAFKGQRITAE